MATGELGTIVLMED